MIVFLNAYTKGLSGGDKIALSRLKKIKNPLIVTSKLGQKLIFTHQIKACFFTTSDFSSPLLTYLKRTIQALALKPLTRTQILSTSDSFPDIVPAFFLKLRHPRLTWTIHFYHLVKNPFVRPGSKISNLFSYLSQRFCLFLIRLKADQIITYTPQAKNILVRLKFSPSKIILKTFILDPQSFQNIKPSASKFDAVFLGRLHPTKGLNDLIIISQLVKKAKPDFKLAVIGIGSKKHQHLLLPYARLFGFLPDQKAYSLIKSAKVFISPSREEGLGIAPLEALSLGTPVIVWDLKTYSPQLKKQAILIKPFNHRQFSAAVLKCLN